ncbi:hypothetical protein M404DRAFT_173050 [Pisolithus tinctorius Marx 270]|uniref:Uncharacterized protein n=1 Tax=Pisolithus tinctorius Marx 270 TaxID=870435 RepID=A0A0C3PY34_PISTI|nr:hypothetical protein M404DRAFT_173050 [Pisolithus tinctorius Marx 270]
MHDQGGMRYDQFWSSAPVHAQFMIDLSSTINGLRICHEFRMQVVVIFPLADLHCGEHSGKYVTRRQRLQTTSCCEIRRFVGNYNMRQDLGRSGTFC